MVNDKLKSSILSIKLIANIDDKMAEELQIPKGYKSIGILTGDSDDVMYTALDNATKMAEVEVIYGKSFYGGAANANTKLAGEVIGIIAGPTPAEVRSGLDTIVEFVENEACFYSANEDDTIPYYAHCISRTGTYLSKTAGIEAGEALAYLVAPPLESIYALDVALKSADVELKALFGPPTETNFGGGLLTGSQSACKVACEAFAEAVKFVAENPKKY